MSNPLDYQVPNYIVIIGNKLITIELNMDERQSYNFFKYFFFLYIKIYIYFTYFYFYFFFIHFYGIYKAHQIEHIYNTLIFILYI